MRDFRPLPPPLFGLRDRRGGERTDAKIAGIPFASSSVEVLLRCPPDIVERMLAITLAWGLWTQGTSPRGLTTLSRGLPAVKCPTPFLEEE